MASYDNSYSRFVAFTKITLPIVALGILSTLFLFSRNIDPSQSIPYAKVDVENLAKEQRLGAPNYAGVTEDGSAISITAQSAQPDLDNPDRILANDITAKIEDANGGHLDITSGSGVINSKHQILILKGGVHIVTSSGFIIDTSGITSSLGITSVVTDGEITADGPLGLLKAGKMEVLPQNGPKASHLLVFKGGVKLIYDPKG